MVPSSLARDSTSNPFVSTVAIVEATAPSIVASSFFVTPAICWRVAMPAGGWALVGVTVGDVSSSATAIGTGGVAVDVDGCGPDGCTLRGEGGECAAGEAVTILVSSSSGIDSSSCDA